MTPATVPALLAEQARVHGDRTALIGNDGTGVYRRIGFAGLWARACAIAGRLGDTVGRTRDGGASRVCWIYGNANGLTALTIYHGVLAAGGVNVPVNPASTPAEVEAVLALVRPALVIAPAATLAGVSLGDVPGLAIEDLGALEAWAPSGVPGTPPGLAAEPDDTAAVLLTSGTTGRSKGVVHSHRSSLAAGAGWNAAFGHTSADVYQSMFPVYAGAGLHFSGLNCLLTGTTYVVDETRPTSASLRRVDEYGATVYGAVPSIYQYWLAEDLAEHDLSTLRLLDFGGAVMHRSTIEALRERIPRVELIQTYGLTEAGPGGLFLPPEHLDAKLGSIGCVATDGLRFRVDPAAASAEEGAAGTHGELCLSGTSVMSGYLGDPESTARVFDGEWLRTGDLVRVDDEGFVYFVDRLKDIIIRGGLNISSLEVEETLLAHPGVQQVAAYGHPHESLGEVVAVAIVPASGGLDLADLRRFATERLARPKVPARVVLVDALPVSAAGKVLKSALRERDDFVEEWEG